MPEMDKQDSMTRVGILLGGIGLLLLGIAAMAFVVIGPPMSAEERMKAQMLQGFLPDMQRDIDAARAAARAKMADETRPPPP